MYMLMLQVAVWGKVDTFLGTQDSEKRNMMKTNIV